MSVNQTILEKHEQEVPLHTYRDEEVSAAQIQALEVRNVVATEGKVRTAGAKIKYTHLEPENPVDDVGIIIANGYWAPRSAYASYAAELALRGHRVTHICPPRTQSLFASVQPEQIKDVLLLQAQALWAVMKVLGEDQYDIYGHSTGTPIGARVADEKYAHIRSLLLAGGAGLNGRNSVGSMLLKSGDLVKRNVIANMRELQEHNSSKVFVDAMYHGFRRIDRTIREGVTVAHEDVRPRLERAKNRNIKIVSLLFDKDIYYPPDSVLAASGHLFDAVHRAPSASHIYPQDHPLQHSYDTAAMSRQVNSSSVQQIA